MLDKRNLMENDILEFAAEGVLKEENKEKTDKKMATYYEKLRIKVDSWMENINVSEIIRDIILSAPDMFYLTWKLTFEPEVGIKHKRKMAYALVYFISPIDIVPDILGGVGYVDDVIVVCYALNALFNEVDRKYIDKYWHGNLDIFEFVQMVIREVNNVFAYLTKYVKNPFGSFMSNIETEKADTTDE